KAEFDLARLYFRGHGKKRDLVKARRMFEAAAKKGHSRAQLFLGRIYYLGEGTPKDRAKAYFWLTLASAEQGQTAAILLDRLRGQMSREEIERAKKLAARFQPELGD
ncbi:MAG: hypothetical protein QF491_11635, partial [Alphaproteobacteria bacterium]|nr:hypothetical protein [Alphaproteobacteria bacterium]